MIDEQISLKEKYKLYDSFFDIIPQDNLMKIIIDTINTTENVKYNKSKFAKIKYSPVVSLLFEKNDNTHTIFNDINNYEELYESYIDYIRKQLFDRINSALSQHIKDNALYMEIMQERHIDKDNKCVKPMKSFLTTIFSLDLERKKDDELLEDYKKRNLLLNFKIYK